MSLLDRKKNSSLSNWNLSKVFHRLVFILDLINMFHLLDDHVLDDIVSRAEQSRVSYNIQTEEFRHLNGNLQTYLSDIKTIDDENHQLQNNIEQIRSNRILTLENHFKDLPDDFRQQSYTLTEAHLERYKSKSRAKRFISEREELKKRIHFVTNNDKIQTKQLNNLQKQERLTHSELLKLNEQIKNVFTYVETERQTHRQAMIKVDNLQGELERISVERSKTEVKKKLFFY
jgi:chromosome segregation ATPase